MSAQVEGRLESERKKETSSMPAHPLKPYGEAEL